MASREHIFFSADGDPETLAAWLAARLDMTVKHDDLGNVYVFRAGYAHPGEIGGQVRENVVANPDPEPGEESLTDDFTTMIDVYYTGRNEQMQRDEARRLFAAFAPRSPSPSALLSGFEIVIGVAPAEGEPVWLPAGTTPEAGHRDRWGAYRPGR